MPASISALTLLGGLVMGCSTAQDTITANIYHNTTARYNGYYYAREKIEEIEASLAERTDDNYNQIPRLYPKLDSTLSYSEEAKEAIKMASFSIQRHPNSKWLYPDYLLVAKARLYDHDIKNAIQTFKYVNTKSRDLNTKHLAVIGLARAFIENDQYDEAREALALVEAQQPNRSVRKQLYLETAYYHQLVRNYEQMAKNLQRADMPLTRKDGKGRIYLITGQVYQRIGFPKLAYMYYKKSLRSTPVYKLDLYARLGLLQTAPINQKNTTKKTVKAFQRMLKDSKNKEFENKVYYELAEFEGRQGRRLEQAMVDYQKAANAEGDQAVRGYALLKLGVICFDSLAQYGKAAQYYDSALRALPKDMEEYEEVARLGKALKELVENQTVITWQDSLLYMASLDSTTLNVQLQATFERQIKEKKAQEEAKAKAARAAAANAEASRRTTVETGTSDSPNWYFENPTLVSLGQTEFQQIWGDIPLTDDWRRSNRQKQAEEGLPTTAQGEAAPDKAVDDEKDETAEQSKNAAELAQKIVAQVPRTPAQRTAARRQIEEAYFNVGEIFLFRLDKRTDAIGAYTTLVERFPHSPRAPEALYRLCATEANNAIDLTGTYCARLIREYPESDFTKTLLNPSYRKERHIAQEQQESLYQKAYESFERGNIQAAQQRLDEAVHWGKTSMTPHLELLQALIVGKTERLALYQAALRAFVKKYTESPLANYAAELLDAANEAEKKAGDLSAIRYSRTLSGPHCLVVVYAKEYGGQLSEPLSDMINTLAGRQREGPNAASYREFDESNLMIRLCGLADASSAMTLMSRLKAQILASKALSAYTLTTFAIASENEAILERTKALSEYLVFFGQNYQAQTNFSPKSE